MPLSRHMTAHMLSLYLSLCFCMNHENLTSVLQKTKKTQYDWQKHPHAHIEI